MAVFVVVAVVVVVVVVVVEHSTLDGEKRGCFHLCCAGPLKQWREISGQHLPA